MKPLMSHSPSPRRLLLASIAAATLALAGCHSSMPPPTPLSQLNPQQLRGRQVFVQYCASCHHANSQKDLHGPGLEGLFRRKYLPSGLPATDQHVITEIQYGRDMMPPFGNVLNNQQIQDLLAYLHTL
jgi:mono/diheme cytochrome c family protein